MSGCKDAMTDNKAMARKRVDSFGNIKEMLQRKWEDGEGNKKGENDIFRKCKKTPRSPGRKGKTEESKLENVMRKWKEEMEEMIKESRDIKTVKEEVKLMKEEIKERIREQEKWLREEMKAMRKKFLEQEKLWREEKEELKGYVKDLLKKVKVLKKYRKGGGRI